MQQKKKDFSKDKSKLHDRSKHKQRYNFDQLIQDSPELKQHVKLNIHGDQSVDFANPVAVKALNKALLIHFYNIKSWDIPEGYLCPPIPGRADYIHHIADLLRNNNYGKIPTGSKITCLDVGTGANCIYPIIGHNEYSWRFIASEIDDIAIANAKQIIDDSPELNENVSLRKQNDSNNILDGIIKAGEKIDITICNPPFHASEKEALEGTKRKLKNLKLENTVKPTLNFGGKNNELWCKGGEEEFISNMIIESIGYANQCFWFSSLVSKQSTLKSIQYKLKESNATKVEIIPMGQGNKTSRIIAWTFLDAEAQKLWRNSRWNIKKS